MKLAPLVFIFFSLVSGYASANGVSDLDLPSFGESSHQGLSLKRQKKLGYEAYQRLRRQGHILNDPESTAYIQSLGKRIAAASEWNSKEFTFFIVRSDAVNAFAMPGGFIGINAGLITLAETEEELAGVLGHEVAHVTQQHIARVVEATKPMAIATAATVIAAIIVGAHDPQAAHAMLAAANALHYEQQISFTRIHEHEADRVAVGLLESAGINPEGLPSFFQKIHRKGRAYSQKYADFFRTHPYSHERIVETQERIKQSREIKNSESTLFSLIRERVRAISSYSTAEALQHYLDADSSSTANRYGKALVLQRGARANQAYAALKGLLREDPDNLLLQLSVAQAALSTGRAAAANTELNKTLKQYPDNLLAMYRKAEVALINKQPQEALHWLQRIRVKRPFSPEIQSLLGRAAADLGMLADAHIHTANAMLYQGQHSAAVDRLQKALRAEGLSAHDQQRIKAKLGELQR